MKSLNTRNRYSLSESWPTQPRMQALAHIKHGTVKLLLLTTAWRSHAVLYLNEEEETADICRIEKKSTEAQHKFCLMSRSIWQSSEHWKKFSMLCIMLFLWDHMSQAMFHSFFILQSATSNLSNAISKKWSTFSGPMSIQPAPSLQRSVVATSEGNAMYWILHSGLSSQSPSTFWA